MFSFLNVILMKRKQVPKNVCPYVKMLIFFILGCEKKIIAYFNTGNLQALYTNDVDYVIFAFAYPNKDGTVSLDEQNKRRLEDNLEELKKLQSKGVKILISVGGYEHSYNFKFASKTPEGRKSFASSLKDLMEEYKFDGVDIDWEYKKLLNKTDAAHYVDLVRAMRNAIDKVIGVTIFRIPERVSSLDYTSLNDLVDYYSLLSYEYSGAVWSKHTGFNTPLPDIKTSTKALLEFGVSEKKLYIGLAFYGQQFGDVGSGNVESNGLNELFDKQSSNSMRIDYKDIQDVSTAQYDPNAAAVYIYQESKKVLITFDNIESIRAKCEYIKSRDNAGAMVWELGGDKNGELLKAVVKSLKTNSGMAS